MNMEKTQHYANAYITWKAPAYRYQKKPLGWYLVMGTMVLLFVIWGIYSASYVLSLTFVILAVVYFFLQKEEPPLLRVEITDSGIRFGKDFYNYSEINSFWMYHRPPDIASLNILIRRKVLSHIEIDFPMNMPVAPLRDYLLTQIPEQAEREESISETLIRHLGL